MEKEITLGTILEHIQAMKNDLQAQIVKLDVRISGLDTRMSGLEGEFIGLKQKMDRGFEDARQHREAIQEDLLATMRLTYKHEKKLARMK